MKIGLATVQVPFMHGGAEMHVHGLLQYLRGKDYQAEIITIPFKWYPPDSLSNQMEASRLIDVSEVNGKPLDLLITFKFPAYYLRHPNKNLWLLHQHRQAYDFFNTSNGDLHLCKRGRKVASKIKEWDDLYIPDHKHIFTNSQNVANRLSKYNNIDGSPLYPPPLNAERFQFKSIENFILAPGRLDKLKRQDLIIKAMAYSSKSLKLILIGSDKSEYGEYCKRLVEEYDLSSRVCFLGFVDTTQKIDLYSRALAIYNGVFDEDLGYLTIEAFLSGKPVITHHDSGGPLEFVEESVNGFVTKPDELAIADKVNYLVNNHNNAKEMGFAGKDLIKSKNISWENVIERLIN
jgi:glycosyltransferase involved in cell wall biosynthesis